MNFYEMCGNIIEYSLNVISDVGDIITETPAAGIVLMAAGALVTLSIVVLV